MPTYVYQCAKCDEQLEAWQSFTDAPLKRHSGCGGKLAKVLQPVGIVLKGSGFYRTDSRSGSVGSAGARKDSGERNGSEGASKSASTSDSAGPSAKQSDSTSSTKESKGSSKPAPAAAG